MQNSTRHTYTVQFLRTSFDSLQTEKVFAESKKDAIACVWEMHGRAVKITCCVQEKAN